VPQTRESFSRATRSQAGLAYSKKTGTASLIGQARDLKKIASKSSTLLKLLKRADRKTFETWAAVPYPEAVAPEMATQQWLQLKDLLDITVQRATQSARRVENTLKSAARRLAMPPG
jgi:hypothetical protein